VLAAPPLLTAASLRYASFPLKSAAQAVHATDGAVALGTSFIVASAEGATSQGGALPSSLGMRLASLDIPVNSGFRVDLGSRTSIHPRLRGSALLRAVLS
jgi:hypothetical protein